MADDSSLAPGAARLIALDWGTSNLRAYALGEDGSVLATRSGAVGVMAVSGGAFEEALQALIGDWLRDQPCALIAAGMIGSRQGWREAPYIACPAGLVQAAAQLTTVSLAGQRTLHIVPGLRCLGSDGEYDVMRGEETQLWGADLAAGACGVLPGTHAKWARVAEGGRIDSFRTYMTGELFALLTQHGILGRLMVFGEARPAAFEQGVRLGLAEHARATHILFAARTAGLLGRIEPEGLPDFLSGLLIGIEIGSEAADGPLPPVVTVVGDAGLGGRYERALGMAGVQARVAPDDVGTRGLWRVAQAAGLIEQRS